MKYLDCLKNQSVLVVGDMMVDKYITGTVDRISPEAPVPVLRESEITRKLGGTGNVVANIVSLGAKAKAVGRVGNDEDGGYFLDTIKKLGVDSTYIFVHGITTVKTRVSAKNQQFLRIDNERNEPPTLEMVSKVEQNIDKILNGITVVILSDYAKGFLTEEVCRLIISSAKARNIPVLVDPKGSVAFKYTGATAITPNSKEFRDMTGIDPSAGEDKVRDAGLKLCEENALDVVIFTRSEKGITTISLKDKLKKDYPAIEKEVVDVTGAGDTVVSVIALALAAGFELSQCVKLANVAASIVISRFGASQTTIDEIQATMAFSSKTYDTVEGAIRAIEVLKEKGKRIVFTNGCFDLVHAGHISGFRQARSFGDVLVVGVNSDASVRSIKGEKRPILNEKHRVALLSALECVDYVIPFEEDTPQKLIEQLRPDVLVKGKDWEGKEIAGGAFVASYGGQVKFIELEQGLSTTTIIEKIRSLYI